MEFFAYAKVRMSAADIQRHININNLTEWCSSIDTIIDVQGERGDIYCVWGEFRVHRELIHDGVRFTLPNCKNGVQWTLSPNPENSAQVMVHCTINRPTQEADFVESLEEFVDAWRVGLEGWPARRAAKLNRPRGECSDTFGGFG
ncbi:MAG: hypothetical protein OQK94_11650 [Gammaproteobacteria bacterium]|nr:hypothetical protein [Gammaproteobacteria bacterium]MCW8957899.1 hypothetical protein [Gammaproteobacteria bacterium]MCW8973834.1 hypothetical protein [Gammaproteobacteria bacterium]MCW8992764.1 hypothetical protein [Gammaproteobacteria bacterium]